MATTTCGKKTVAPVTVWVTRAERLFRTAEEADKWAKTAYRLAEDETSDTDVDADYLFCIDNHPKACSETIRVKAADPADERRALSVAKAYALEADRSML